MISDLELDLNKNTSEKAKNCLNMRIPDKIHSVFEHSLAEVDGGYHMVEGSEFEACKLNSRRRHYKV